MSVNFVNQSLLSPAAYIFRCLENEKEGNEKEEKKTNLQLLEEQYCSYSLYLNHVEYSAATDS